MPTTEVFVGVGSNLRPHENLELAVDELRRRYRDLRWSSVYRNEAVGFSGEDFLNLVVAFHTEDPVEKVVDTLAHIEQHAGRERGSPRFGPRTLDLDLLLYGDRVTDQPLRLPRPDILEHAFVLGPLAELAGDRRHPICGERFADLWARFDRAAHPLVRVRLPGLDSRL